VPAAAFVPLLSSRRKAKSAQHPFLTGDQPACGAVRGMRFNMSLRLAAFASSQTAADQQKSRRAWRAL